jgi:dipeptidyl aminopeptidase/acylaminoacyl peptidase
VFIPRAHNGIHLPQSLVTFSLTATAVVGTIVAWAILTASPTSTDFHVVAGLPPDPSAIRSVAYSVPGPREDAIYVRTTDPDATPTLVATFKNLFGLHARGLASPQGDRIAVLSVSNYPLSVARMSIVDLVTGVQHPPFEAEFEYLSHLSWAPDGERIAGVRYSLMDNAGRVLADVLETDARTGLTSIVARFDNAIEVAPVGYSPDGERLFIVVVDQAGSNLWVERAGKLQRVGQMSGGRTRDWSMSHDGARLAFIDVRAGTGRVYVGRTMLIATGAVNDASTPGDQIGVAWPPASEVADFGGPGGSVRLAMEPPESAYVIPVRWSPDGSVLAARVVTREGDSTDAGPSEFIELATSESRIRLSEGAGAWFFGWVNNIVE